jgi:hypothetical protein
MLRKFPCTLFYCKLSKEDIEKYNDDPEHSPLFDLNLEHVVVSPELSWGILGAIEEIPYPCEYTIYANDDDHGYGMGGSDFIVYFNPKLKQIIFYIKLTLDLSPIAQPDWKSWQDWSVTFVDRNKIYDNKLIMEHMYLSLH